MMVIEWFWLIIIINIMMQDLMILINIMITQLVLLDWVGKQPGKKCLVQSEFEIFLAIVKERRGRFHF